MDKAKQKENYKSASAGVLSLLLASIVLFPAAVGILKPPYYYLPALCVYLGSVIIASLVLAAAYYLAAWTERNPPHKTGSTGLATAVICLGAFMWFFFGNLAQDQTAPPEIVNLAVDKGCVEPGGFVTLSAEGADQSGGSLRWRWTARALQPRPGARVPLSSVVRTALWRAPSGQLPNHYEIQAVASDGDVRSEPQSLRIEVKGKCDG